MANPKIGAPPFFGTLFIDNDDYPDGWSESYWIDQAGYNDALTALGLIRDARMHTLTDEFVCMEARISDSTIRNDTLVDPLQRRGDFEGSLTPSGESLPSDDCWLWRWELNAITPRHVVRLMHGVPRSAVPNPGNRSFHPTPAWITVFNAYESAITTNCTGVVKVAGSNPATWVSLDILSTSYAEVVHDHKVGRPFGLFHGRRAIV
jgi:hypothetical protein